MKKTVIFVISFLTALAATFVFSKLSVADNKVINLPAIIATPTLPQTAFSLENAPGDSLKGRITQMAGVLSWQGRTATQSAQITSPITLQQGESLQTGDGSAEVTFGNAVNVKLGGNSAVDFTQILPQSIVFAQSRGLVTYEKTGNFPVYVRILHLIIGFDGKISVTLKNSQVDVIIEVVEGSAKVAYNNLNYKTQTVNLERGHMLNFNDRKRKAVVK